MSKMHEISVELVGNEVRCVYINDYRVAGSKPWFAENPKTKTFTVSDEGMEMAHAQLNAKQINDLEAELQAVKQNREQWEKTAGSWFSKSLEHGEHIAKLEAELRRYKDALTIAAEGLEEIQRKSQSAKIVGIAANQLAAIQAAKEGQK